MFDAKYKIYFCLDNHQQNQAKCKLQYQDHKQDLDHNDKVLSTNDQDNLVLDDMNNKCHNLLDDGDLDQNHINRNYV